MVDRLPESSERKFAGVQEVILMPPGGCFALWKSALARLVVVSQPHLLTWESLIGSVISPMETDSSKKTEKDLNLPHAFLRTKKGLGWIVP